VVHFPVKPEKQRDLELRMKALGLAEVDLEEGYTRASGRGGQKLHKTSNCVTLHHRPTGTRIRCEESRSQALNRFLARRRLVEVLESVSRASSLASIGERQKVRRQKDRRARRARGKSGQSPARQQIDSLIALILISLLWLAGTSHAGGGGPSVSLAEGLIGKSTPAAGKASARAGWEKWEKVPCLPLHSEVDSLRLTADWWIRLFQRKVSPVDGPSCSFSPTCSAYAMEAVRKHGLLAAIPMAAERVMRDHRPQNPDRYSLVEQDGTFYYHDPVNANDFWWSAEP